MIADLIILMIMILCVYLGYSRGLIKVSVRILSFLVSLIVALILYTPISNYIIENTDVVSNLEEVIASKLYNKSEREESLEENKNIDIASSMEKYINEYTEGVKENTSEFIAGQIAVCVVRIGTWMRIVFNC